MTCTDVAKITGQTLLFLGTETVNWTFSQFTQAAQFAKAHGVDSLLLKVADGGNWWYGGINGYRQIKNVIQTSGVGCIPYTYSYGDRFGFLDGEITMLKLLMDDSGVVCMDAETEWNGQVTWAQRLCSQMQGYPGVFLVSTWADPDLQNWGNVLKALNPCVDAYMPQQYDNYLASCWNQFAGAACLQPTLEMTQGVGANDVVAIARAAHDQGHTAISIWHYGNAVNNPALLDQILAAFPKTIQPSEDPIVTIDLTNATVASHFTGDSNQWTCKETKFTLHGEILAFYQSYGGNALCGLTHLGLPLSGETPVPNKPGIVWQAFERGVLIFDPDHIIDNPPGSGRVYMLHIDKGLGMDPRIGQLSTQNAALANQVSTLQGENAALKALPIVTNLTQIQTVGQTIKDDVDMIMKLAQIQ
jgi:hypothetical protein